MNLTDAQQQVVKRWLEEGLKLAEVQKRLESELGLQMTYMDVRMLMADLSLMPKDTEPSPTPDLGSKVLSGKAPATTNARSAAPESWPAEPEDAAPPGGGRVAVRVDQVTRPGAVVSGSVSFSDGQTAQWYLDQRGQLGLMPARQGYRPSAADVQDFQMALQEELQKLGM